MFGVEIQGVGLIGAFGSPYDQFLEESSIEALLKTLKKKVMEIPGEFKKQGKFPGITSKA